MMQPVFILGHPRTGTTHLHNLLCKDDRFAYATTFSVGFPSGFLSTSWLAPYLGRGHPPPTRSFIHARLNA